MDATSKRGPAAGSVSVYPFPDRMALVRGLGDIGSAVAHRLFSEGYNVIIHDGPYPATTRRTMAFTDAAFEGAAVLEGVEARRASDVASIPSVLALGFVTVYVGPLESLTAGVRFDVLVDARMRKRDVPDDQRGLAAITVGLGPNFEVGVSCDVAVETSWNALGAVIRSGAPLPLAGAPSRRAGEPGEIGGHGRERYVYAPEAGIFETTMQIGNEVRAGQPVATIGETVLAAPLSGTLRGLTRHGVPVAVQTKVIEVDPRGRAAPEIAGIAEAPQRTAEGVIAAIGGLRRQDPVEHESPHGQWLGWGSHGSVTRWCA